MYDDLSGSDLSEGSLNVDHVIIDTEKVESSELNVFCPQSFIKYFS